MIYDHVVTIHNLIGGGVLGAKLDPCGESFYCAPRTVGLNRYYTALQVGDQTDAVLEMPGRDDIRTKQIAVYYGHQYRILQVQHTNDDDGLHITVISLSRLEELYDFASAE